MGDFPIGDLAGLSAPAKTLIEKVSDAVGGIAKPWQIVRVAKAGAAAKLIKAEAEAKAEIIRAETRITDVERRALVRLVREEGQKQENIEGITNKAIPLLTSDAKPENIEKDWLTRFFDRSRIVSDQEMQSFWARILASEANRPGSFSLKTIDLTSTLSKRDAELFTNFCTFVWDIEENEALIFDYRLNLYRKFGIKLDQILHLQSIGLITYSAISGYSKSDLKPNLLYRYHGKPVVLHIANSLTEIEIGNVILSETGRELSNICGAKPSKEFYEYVISRWTEAGLAPHTPIASRDVFITW